jgi:hypothetical protein
MSACETATRTRGGSGAFMGQFLPALRALAEELTALRVS